MPIGHSPCIWHTELGCIAFPGIIGLQMISSRDVYSREERHLCRDDAKLAS